jgi:hypothetical protein
MSKQLSLRKTGRDKDASRSQTSSSPVFPKTPGSDSSDIRVDLTSPAVPPSSVLSSRRASSPPTSDIIDVDMLASDEEDQSVVMKTVNTFTLRYLHNTDAKSDRLPIADRSEKS